ncbi:MAG: DUF116 domain-containing protein [Candidatus Altiarchaeota archaeon]
MVVSLKPLEGVAVVVGVAALLFIVLALLSCLFLLISLILYRKYRVTLFPNLALSIVRVGENMILKGFMLLGIGGDWVTQTLVALKNHVGKNDFMKIRMSERAIFVPQCIRSASCPAKSDYEGLHCISCGQCTIGALKKEAEGLGYMFFVAPGSSLVKRMTKKYQPKGAIGLGCLMEIKEFLILMDKMKVKAYGVILDSSGCVETTYNLEKLTAAMKMHSTD